MKRKTILVITITILTAIILTGCRNQEEENTEEVTRIENVPPEDIVDEVEEIVRSQAAQMFNSRWQGFAHTPQTPASIRALLNQVNSNNTIDVNRPIELTGITEPSNANMYNVNFEYDEQGFINEINITICPICPPRGNPLQ